VRCDSIPLPPIRCSLAYRLDIGLDPGFKEFYYWCKDNGVPFVIVSR
jgi:2-hydroxy-3-keto-5-methylthiopentenyl-1-phosphate phosphatase